MRTPSDCSSPWGKRTSTEWKKRRQTEATFGQQRSPDAGALGRGPKVTDTGILRVGAPNARRMVAGAPGIGENCGGGVRFARMDEKEKDPRRCFKCGRDLGPLLEWKKMDTDAGPICYACFNEAAGDARRGERTR